MYVFYISIYTTFQLEQNATCAWPSGK